MVNAFGNTSNPVFLIADDMPTSHLTESQFRLNLILMKKINYCLIIKICHHGKLAASCTEIQQPCDVGNIFKGSKSANKNIDDSDVISHPLNMVIQDDR